MVDLTPKVPKATEEDYIEIQGGVPKVSREGKIKTVIHDYPKGEGMIVRSHIEHGTVNLNTSRGSREFKIDLLKQFHGDPCEKQSRSSGGEGYERGK